MTSCQIEQLCSFLFLVRALANHRCHYKYLGGWQQHCGKITGAFFGVLMAIMIILFGFFNTLFIAICGFIGYILGRKFDKSEDFMEILQKILPNNFWR